METGYQHVSRVCYHIINRVFLACVFVTKRSLETSSGIPPGEDLVVFDPL